MRTLLSSNIKLLFTLLLIGGLYCNSFSQNFEWLNTYAAQSGVYIENIVAEPGGTNLVELRCFTQSSIDTIKIDTFKFTQPANSVYHYWVRSDENGKAIMVKKMWESLGVSKICRSNTGEFYIAGSLNIREKNIIDTTLSEA
jgi:hypothetical protein